MTSEQKVKRLWPDAKIEDMGRDDGARPRPRFRVTITPGRYAYGRMKSWAWTSAWIGITQDEELSKGAGPGAQEGEHG
jgi:hypothetical protein